MSAHVVKRRRDVERFEDDKLHQSIVAACLAVRAFDGEAHATAEQVCHHVADWLTTKTEVTSADIRRVAASHLVTYHPEAAYMYEHHRLIA